MQSTVSYRSVLLHVVVASFSTFSTTRKLGDIRERTFVRGRYTALDTYFLDLVELFCLRARTINLRPVFKCSKASSDLHFPPKKRQGGEAQSPFLPRTGTKSKS